MNSNIIKYAIQNLLKRKVRSWLTVLSILVGIMAIFALVSFGVGVRGYVNEISEEMGMDKIFIQPGGFQPPGVSTIVFTDRDVNAIKKIVGVDTVVPSIMSQTEVKYDLKNQKDAKIKIYAPNSFEVINPNKKLSSKEHVVRFNITNLNSLDKSIHDVFAVIEFDENELHYSSIDKAKIMIIKNSYKKNFYFSFVPYITLVVLIVLWWYLERKDKRKRNKRNNSYS